MRTMRHPLIIGIGVMVGLAVVWPSAQDASGQLPPQTFRSAVDVVTIRTSVRDARGRVLSGLTTADFDRARSCSNAS